MNSSRDDIREKGRQGVVKLSRRLMQVADFVKPGSRIADIGTDHGFVPVYLAQTGRIRSGLAMDVGTGPLERAKEHIREYEAWAAAGAVSQPQLAAPGSGELSAEGLIYGAEGSDAQPGNGSVSGVCPIEGLVHGAERTDFQPGSGSVSSICPIEARLSNGLGELKPGEADTVIMAGMGGGLVIRILEEGRHVWDSVERWILSPQSDLERVRHFLEAMGFEILEEAMVKEEGKFYTVMNVGRGRMKYERQIEYLYGARLIEKKDPVLKEYLDQEMHRVEEIRLKLEGEGSEPVTEGRSRAYEALSRELLWIKEAQDEMQ